MKWSLYMSSNQQNLTIGSIGLKSDYRVVNISLTTGLGSYPAFQAFYPAHSAHAWTSLVPALLCLTLTHSWNKFIQNCCSIHCDCACVHARTCMEMTISVSQLLISFFLVAPPPSLPRFSFSPSASFPLSSPLHDATRKQWSPYFLEHPSLNAPRRMKCCVSPNDWTWSFFLNCVQNEIDFKERR